jgi:hypothetical protein
VTSSNNPVRLIAFSLALLLAAQAAIAPAQETGPPDQLRITILDGDNAIDNTRQRTVREPIVQVEDEHHNRIPGAIIVFMLPDQGAGGTFLNGERSLTVTTDSQGQAVAHGLRPNSLIGKYEIRVNASYQGMTGHAVIHRENAAPPPATHAYVKWIVIGAVVAGGLAGGLYATRGSSKPTSPTVTLTLGAGTVGAP